jgi:long-chain acyl-CoA synthetase
MAALELGPNLVALFAEQAKRRADRPFLWAKREGIFRPWSWREVADQVRLLARALAAEGLKPGDRVLLVGENRPEWAIADLAIMSAGGITVPAYTTNTIADHAYLLEHSGATAVIVSDAKLAARLLPALTEAPAVRFVISMEPLGDVGQLSVPVLDWQGALALGERESSTDPAAGERLGKDDTACFIYTSGTGGQPKAVMLTHRNIISNVLGAYAVLEQLGVEHWPTWPARTASWRPSVSTTRCSCRSCRCPTPTSTPPDSSCRSRSAPRSTTPRVSTA